MIEPLPESPIVKATCGVGVGVGAGVEVGWVVGVGEGAIAEKTASAVLLLDMLKVVIEE